MILNLLENIKNNNKYLLNIKYKFKKDILEIF